MTQTLLDVPFAEKDTAKALGARWNAQLRKWYVPQGNALEPFARWLPAAVQPAAAVPAASQEQGGDYQQLTRLQGVPLSQLLGQVRAVVSNAFAQGVWTLVDVVRVQINNGHVYLELAERGEQGEVRAQARGMIWAARAAQILPEFRQATGGIELADGIKLLVRAKPNMHERFGLGLDIDAIDPDYSLGDLEARKKQLRLRLQQEGIFAANRQLPPVWDFNHVLVLAPPQAAGLGDFQAEAERLQALGLCRFSYVFGRFQGEGAGSGLATLLKDALQQHQQAGEQPDTAVIIRGGGSVNDLAWLNDYDLARAICQLDIPVLTGIGHERDSTLVDEVAHDSFDTPSKVIAGIERRIVLRAREAREFYASIQELALRQVRRQGMQLEQNMALVQQGARASLAQAREQSSRWFADLRLNALQQVQIARETSRNLLEQGRSCARQQLNQAGRQVPLWMTQIRSQAQASIRQAQDNAQLQMERIVSLSQADLEQSRWQLRQQLDTVQHESARQLARMRQQLPLYLDTVQQSARLQLRDARQSSTALFREVIGQGPDKTLARGFALVRDAQGQVVSSPKGAQPGQPLSIQFHQGQLSVQVSATQGEPQDD